MKLLLNILWLLLGDIFTAVEYLVASMVMIITIIGIPFGLQTLRLALVALWPFGKEIHTQPTSGGCLNLVMNVIWICIGGVWIALSHLFFRFTALYYYYWNSLWKTIF